MRPDAHTLMIRINDQLTNENLIGVVLNGARNEPGSGYGYHYHYRPQGERSRRGRLLRIR